MRERPILFSGPMVRAILAGRKTQTRRIVTPQPPAQPARYVDERGSDWFVDGTTWCRKSTYGERGDRLWVREPWQTTKAMDGMDAAAMKKSCVEEAGYPAPWAPLLYRADGERTDWDHGLSGDHGAPGRKRLARFMPRWASRITLEVTDVRVQRLQDISEEDAQAEGLTCLTKDGGQVYKWGIPDRDGWPGNDDDGWHWQDWCRDPREAFAKLWDEINGERAPWASNPWLWCVSFRRIEST